MGHKLAVLLPVFLCAIILGTAQESRIFTHDQKRYQDALALYNNKQYQAAQTLFLQVSQDASDEETKANSAYYVANAAVRLNQVGADQLMEDFVEEYPTSTKRNSAFLDVADYYFANGKYPYALKWYRRVDQTAMSRTEKERFNFNMGYALFTSRKPKEAERYLSKVVNSPEYGSQAKYYLGYIAYQQDDYERANERFDEITDQEVLEEKLSYYQADMNFKLGNFEEAIALAKEQLPKADRREISELNKIIGESYFNLAQYGEAVPYLEEYKGRRGRWSNTDYYQLGYAYYKQGDFANAIQQFNKIVDADDAVAQNAYYHLAECYLKLDKKQEALNAFRNAAQMDYSEEIRKDALLNYARISYEIGNPYEPVPQVLTTFLESYPDSEHNSEIRELLVDSYITSKNFEGAMKLLASNKNYASKTTYQKVAFYYGLEQFMNGDYAEAYDNFSKSLDDAEDGLFEARARYWMAEAAYRLNRFDDALVNYTAFAQHPNARLTDGYDNIQYDLAYAYFKLKDYGKAITHFGNFTAKGGSDPKYYDAYVRLGDSYFVNSQYWKAIEAYNKVLLTENPERDYAAFQKAMSYGFVGKGDTKLEELSSFINRYPKSTLKDDALFELGNSYVKAGQDTRALEAYDKLLTEYRMSSLAPTALLRQGLVHYNANRNEQALGKFKTVVREYPNSQEAIQAVATAKLIYVDEGRVAEYARWVEGLDFVEVTDTELDNASFESADKQYVEGKTEAAIKGFENYVREFPNGLHALQARFTLAQLYFSKGEKDKAFPMYKSVVDMGGNEYGEQALTRVCEILIGDDKYAEAIPYLEQLERTAEIQQNRTFAQSNLMKGYYRQKAYDKVITYAEIVLETPGIDDRIKSDAQIMIARSAIATGDEARAKEAYARVLPIASGSLAAEALYYDAFFKHKDGAHEASNAAVQRLAKDYSPYKEWGGKGLVIMAKNFEALDDAFQATYILENVIANFSEFPDLVSEAKRELAAVKARETERNSSIQTDGN